MAEARYSTNLDKLKKGFFGSGLNKLKAGYVYENGEYVKVWSGATKVSYYDEETLLGIEEIDEGDDVLHPSIVPVKENYTMVGWSTTNSEEGYVTELTAEGEEMTLYAVFVPDTVTAVVGTVSDDNYRASVHNRKYVTGTLGQHDALATGSVGPGWVSAGFDITVSLGFYGKAVVKSNLQTYWIRGDGNPSYTYMGNSTTAGRKTKTLTSDGRVYGSARVYVDDAYWAATSGVESVVLSEPIAWT